jgi:hypothetical protein
VQQKLTDDSEEHTAFVFIVGKNQASTHHDTRSKKRSACFLCLSAGWELNDGHGSMVLRNVGDILPTLYGATSYHWENLEAKE